MIIFDLDGTLADCEHRKHFVRPTCSECQCELTKEIEFDIGWHCNYPCDNVTYKKDWKPDWKSFFEACDKDSPIYSTIGVLKMLSHCNAPIEIWSGRCESVRSKTETWLAKYGITYESIKMRPIGDYTPDEILKEKWLNEALSQCKTIDFVFDDRPKVIRTWQSRGIFVFNCCQNNEEF